MTAEGKSLAEAKIPRGIFQGDATTTTARGVVVIVVGYGHGDTSSNPGRD